MKTKTSLILAMTVSLIFIGRGVTFGQEQAKTQTMQADESALETQTEPEIQWAWGEVLSVDNQRNEFMVKYLDYETDQEKQMTISVDEKTNYENVKSLNDIKPLDTAGIDYIITPEGRNIAKNVSIENLESAKPEGQAVESPALPAAISMEAPATTESTSTTVAGTEVLPPEANKEDTGGVPQETPKSE
jgi:biopolymer transport protein ExbD